jgi:hypothetical protein
VCNQDLNKFQQQHIYERASLLNNAMSMAMAMQLLAGMRSSNGFCRPLFT